MQLPNTDTAANAKPCGICHITGDQQVYIPLEQADIHANIVDLSAFVTLTQTFWQPSSNGLRRAKYIFPVPARAAVCGFEMSAEDGTVITAVAKERDEARLEHHAAMAKGYMTGLVEHVTDDVFSISLGALPASQLITCRTSYVIDLLDDDVPDQVRLQIPVSVGMRYGSLSSDAAPARQVPPHRVSISADVYMTGAIKSITSPTHPTLTVQPNNDPPYTQSAANYTSPDFLSRDFVLSVVAEGLDSPRCVAQRTEEGDIAMQLAVIPRFKLPPIPSQEYIFLVDRSGSMQGDRIDTAKRGLMMLLRSLPARGTTFNIFSFGNNCTGLWPESIEYNEHTLGIATQHVDSMQADMGGTEIQAALEHVFRSRQHIVPTACLLLTDGESWHPQPIIDSVSLAERSADPETPLRVFTLGIGNTTSTELCEGIARAGNGICLMATNSESIIGKCAKLVRAARTYILKNVSVDWGVNSDAPIALRQGPSRIDAVYPGSRLIVFALIDRKHFDAPREVVISGQRDGQGEVLRLTVPVQKVHDMSAGLSHHGLQLIHTLAARRIIMDLEDGDKSNVPADTKALIIKLGTQYQLASRFTSFIAVDKRTHQELEQEPTGLQSPGKGLTHGRMMGGGLPLRGGGLPLRGGGSLRGGSASATFGRAAMRLVDRQLGSEHEEAKRTDSAMKASTVAQSSGSLFGSTPAAPPSSSLFGSAFAAGSSAAPPVPSSSLFGSGPAAPPTAPTLFGSTFTTTHPVGNIIPQQTSPSGSLFASASSAAAIPTHVSFNSFVPPSSPSPAAPAAPTPLFGTPPAASKTSEDKVTSLVRLQSFDGSFAPSDQLALIVGRDLLAQAGANGANEKVWATALAVAYLKKHMVGQHDLLEDLVEKAVAFLEGEIGDVEDVLKRADELIGKV